ncbi:MAG TPA: biopolymer transporter ExbD [Puia sp.]|jgi:biopolymer transport protein ExbD
MAELNQSTTDCHKKTSGVRRSKKLSTRVDLTPMVDLGFLLITFFIFTTSLSRPKALAMILPKDVPDDIKIKLPVSGALTVLLTGHDKVFYYERDDFRTMHLATFAGIRSVILDKKNKTKPSDFMVIVKPDREASYKNIIGILDEMNISGVKKYALVETSPEEKNWIQKQE